MSCASWGGEGFRVLCNENQPPVRNACVATNKEGKLRSLRMRVGRPFLGVPGFEPENKASGIGCSAATGVGKPLQPARNPG